MKRVLFLLALALPAVHANPIMFGVNGGHPNPDGSPLSINNGWLVIVDQTTGAVTPVGLTNNLIIRSDVATLKRKVTRFAMAASAKTPGSSSPTSTARRPYSIPFCRIASRSGSLSKPTHTAPTGAMRRVRWLSSPKTPTLWCT